MKAFICVLFATTALAQVPHQPRDVPKDVQDIPAPEWANGRDMLPIAREGDYTALACGTVDQLNGGELAVIETPNYPYRYPNNANCQWTFEVAAGVNVWTWCETFNVRYRDYFHLDGQRWYGYGDPEMGTLFEPVAVDAARNVIMQFTSNRWGRRTGFKCYVYAEQTNWSSTVPPPTTTTVTTSGGSANTTQSSTGSCSCGVAKTGNRIVGGQETMVNEYPWQVGLVSANGRQPWCGGTLISNQHVLTAAHCTAGGSTSSIAVILGEHRTDDSSVRRVSISKITDDPLYNSNTLANDYSILTLSEPVEFTAEVAPACMPWDTTETYAGQVATVSGWGTLSSGGNQPTVLHDVDVTVQSNAQCQQAYGASSITDVNICAADAGKDSCQGDSGGPLVIQENGRYAVIGVVSWGYGCAMAQYPGVYARVTARKDWILANAQGTQESTCGIAG